MTQPVGVPPWPAGLLLVADPDAPAVRDTVAALLADSPPACWPAELEYLRLAAAGEAESASAAVAGEGVVAAYNRAVLTGDTAALGAIRADRSAPSPVRALAAVAAFTLDTGPAPDAPGPDLPGEVAAMVFSARASAALEAHDAAAAVAELRAGVEAARQAGSPLLAAALGASAADVLHQHGRAAAAVQEATRALDELPPGAPALRRAEVLLLRGVARYDAAAGQEPDRAALLAAVSDLQAALQTFREDRHPEQFAQASQYLALAYLVLPMVGPGDRIRQAVAVASLRAALRVLRPDTHPTEWTSAQLNLANALQYLPSSHQADNLVEAVELYEQLIAMRDPRTDPAGAARLRANQGNALAHLGILDHAEARLSEARALFEQVADQASVAALDEVLAEVARSRAG
jgi:tetratricopeptide (TPR) repeat protein